MIQNVPTPCQKSGTEKKIDNFLDRKFSIFSFFIGNCMKFEIFEIEIFWDQKISTEIWMKIFVKKIEIFRSQKFSSADFKIL